MTDWGRSMFVTPGVVVDGKSGDDRSRRYQSEYPDPARPFLLRRLGQRRDIRQDRSTRQPVDQKHPWNQTTIPRPQKRDFNGKYSWVMCPRWLDKRTGDHLALDTGGGAFARLWATALASLVDMGYVKATGNSVVINLPKTALKPEVTIRVENSKVEQCHRA